MKKETQPQHTRGEWKINKYSATTIEVGDNGRTIASCGGYSSNVIDFTEENIANAQRIVKAVNMHDEMVEHIRKLNDEFVYALTNMAKILKMNMSVESLRIEENTLVKKSKQLLKQADGK